MNLFISGYLLKPYAHVIVFLVVTFVGFILLRPKDANALYTMAGVIYVVFILANSVLIYFAQNTWPYFFVSLLFSLIYLMAVSLLSSLYIQMAKVDGSGESAMMFLVILYHPVVLLLVIFVKWIISRV